MSKTKYFLGTSLLETNVLHHYLDVIHIEKNVFENIFNTVIDIKKITKNNIKARIDITFQRSTPPSSPIINKLQDQYFFQIITCIKQKRTKNIKNNGNTILT